MRTVATALALLINVLLLAQPIPSSNNFSGPLLSCPVDTTIFSGPFGIAIANIPPPELNYNCQPDFGYSLRIDNGRVEFNGRDFTNINMKDQAQRTVEMYVKMDWQISAPEIPIVIWEEGGFNRGMNISIQGDSLIMGMWHDARHQTVSTYWSGYNEWHHLAMVFDGQSGGWPTLTGYLNGQAFDTAFFNNSILGMHPGGNCLGGVYEGTRFKNSPAYISPFNGNVDEVRLWSVARSATEIAQFKNTELNGNDVGLEVYMKFNPGNCTINNIYVSNASIAGTLQNFNFDYNLPNPCESIYDAEVPKPTTSLVNSYTQSADASSVYPVGTTTVNWIATDCAGNIATCQQLVTVIDTNQPTCPQNIIAYVNDSCRGEVYLNPPASSGLNQSFGMGNALHFDGVDDNLSFTPYTFRRKSGLGIADTLIKEHTIQLRFKPDSNDDGVLYSEGFPERSGLIIELVAGNSLNIHVWNSMDDIRCLAGGVKAGEWNSISVVLNALEADSLIKVYVNGVVQSAILDPASNFKGFDKYYWHVANIGALSNVYSPLVIPNFKGSIDEVRVWGKALRHAEINLMHDVPLTGKEPYLQTYFNMDYGTPCGNSNTIYSMQSAAFNTNYHVATFNNFDFGATNPCTSNFTEGPPLHEKYLNDTLYNDQNSLDTLHNLTAGIYTINWTSVYRGDTLNCMQQVALRDTLKPVAIGQDLVLTLSSGDTLVISSQDIDTGSFDNCGLNRTSLSKEKFTCSDPDTNSLWLYVEDNSGNLDSTEVFIYLLSNYQKSYTVYLDTNGTASFSASDLSGCRLPAVSFGPQFYTCANTGFNELIMHYNSLGNAVSDTILILVIDTNAIQTGFTENIGHPTCLSAQDGSIGLNTSASSIRWNDGARGKVRSNLTEGWYGAYLQYAGCALKNADSALVYISGNGNALDETGYLNTSAQNINYAQGMAQQAMQFNGLNSNVVFPDLPILPGTGDYSVSFWAKTSSSSAMNLFTYYECGKACPGGQASGALIISMQNGLPSFYMRGSNNAINMLQGSKALNDGQFHHYALSINRTTNKVEAFVDNQSIGIQTINFNTIANQDGESDPFILGSGIVPARSHFNNFFNGLIDEVRIQRAIIDTSNIEEYGYDYTVNLEVLDTIPPSVITKNITVQLNASGSAGITPMAVNNGSYDSCGINGMSVWPSSFDCSNLGTNTVTLTVTDVNGNQSTSSAIVTVKDTTRPFMAGNSITVNLSSKNAYTLTQNEVNQLGANSTDNCFLSFRISNHSFDCGDVGQSFALSLTGTDSSGNTASVPVYVTVADANSVCNNPPVAACQNITVYSGSTCTASVSPQDIDNGSTDPDGDSLSYSLSTSGPLGIGIHSLTFSVSDNEYTDSCSAWVTVIDTTAPRALPQNITVQLDATGNATIAAADVDNGSYDACGIASVSIDVSSFDCSNVGANPVVLTVTDVNGNSLTANATVTVEDHVAPNAIAQNLTVQLDATGNASITVGDVDNGSNDACGLASTDLSQTAFDCSHVGTNTITLTVTDVNGNTSTAIATVNVIAAPLLTSVSSPTSNGFNITCHGAATGSIDLTVSQGCAPYSYAWSNGATTEDISGLAAGTYSVTVTDASGTVTASESITLTEPSPLSATASSSGYLSGNGVSGATLYLGYGPQSINLSSTASGGVAPYTYSWIPAASIIGANTANPVAVPTAATTYTVTVTDANGCSFSTTVNVDVIDARCGKNLNKVLVCHKESKRKRGQTTTSYHNICVNANAVAAHLAHGDYLGTCVNNNKNNEGADFEEEAFDYHLYPNPTTGSFTVELHSESASDVQFVLTDLQGRVINVIQETTGEGITHYDFDLYNYASGVYVLTITSGNNRHVERIVKQ